MTIFQKSTLAWLGGAVLGGAAGMLTARQRTGRNQLADLLLGAVGGAALVGSVTDKWLETQPGYTGT